MSWRNYFQIWGVADPRVLVGPGVGEDCAVVDMGDRLLIAKSDPVTFASDNVGWYVVQVNANDVACTGGVPRWFLPTVLLPASVTTDDLRSIFRDISEACRQIGVSIIGGHTEVTDGLPRPIVAGTMLGELEDRSRLVSTGGAQDGDSIIVTTGVAIEGAAILAREYAAELRSRGIDGTALDTAASYLDDPGNQYLAGSAGLVRDECRAQHARRHRRRIDHSA